MQIQFAGQRQKRIHGKKRSTTHKRDDIPNTKRRRRGVQQRKEAALTAVTGISWRSNHEGITTPPAKEPMQTRKWHAITKEI